MTGRALDEGRSVIIDWYPGPQMQNTSDCELVDGHRLKYTASVAAASRRAAPTTRPTNSELEQFPLVAVKRDNAFLL